MKGARGARRPADAQSEVRHFQPRPRARRIRAPLPDNQKGAITSCLQPQPGRPCARPEDEKGCAVTTEEDRWREDLERASAAVPRPGRIEIGEIEFATSHAAMPFSIDEPDRGSVAQKPHAVHPDLTALRVAAMIERNRTYRMRVLVCVRCGWQLAGEDVCACEDRGGWVPPEQMRGHLSITCPDEERRLRLDAHYHALADRNHAGAAVADEPTPESHPIKRRGRRKVFAVACLAAAAGAFVAVHKMMAPPCKPVTIHSWQQGRDGELTPVDLQVCD